MPPITQSDRMMKLTSPLGADVLLIETLEGYEGISRLFSFQAELLAATGTVIDPKNLIGQKVTVEISLVDAEGSRYVNGVVAELSQTAGDGEFDVYQAHIVPSLWQLSLSSNCRVFQDKTVMDIVKAVIGTYSLSISDKTETSWKPLDYCTQYNETDLNFVSRLLEQHGISYWFEHSSGDNKIVFSDTLSAYAPCPLVSSVQYAPNSASSDDRYVSSIQELSATASMVSGKFRTMDYDHRSYSANKPDPVSTAVPFANNAYERYAYPGGEEGYVKLTGKALSTPNHAAAFLKAAADASDAGGETFHGTSSARSLVSGYTFTVTQHPRDGWNRKYLLTEVTHHAAQIPSYRSTESGGRGGYSNRFSAIVGTVLFRPRAITPRPTILGPQTAIVVTPSGEDLAIDKLGRVCVQFFWDRLRSANTVDNTWVRVGQPWAGNGWGTFFWPRVKDEVIVQFLNGDPDNPIIVGSVYNGVNVPKYALPDMGTRTGIVTRSSKEGGAANANELRFEDKKGSEQIFLNAEKDMDHRVENDHREFVGAKKSLLVKGAHYDQVDGDRHSTLGANLVEKVAQKAEQEVGTDRNEKVGQNYSLHIGQNHGEKVGMNYAVDAGMNVYLKAGMSLVIEAGLEITIKAAGGFINIGPAGIAISGPMVLINSGGAAGAGTAPQITDPGAPTAPDTADDGTKGGKM